MRLCFALVTNTTKSDAESARRGNGAFGRSRSRPGRSQIGQLLWRRGSGPARRPANERSAMGGDRRARRTSTSTSHSSAARPLHLPIASVSSPTGDPKDVGGPDRAFGVKFGVQFERNRAQLNRCKPNKHGGNPARRYPDCRLGAGRSQVQTLSPQLGKPRKCGVPVCLGEGLLRTIARIERYWAVTPW
jgi:hypothetical protein